MAQDFLVKMGEEIIHIGKCQQKGVGFCSNNALYSASFSGTCVRTHNYILNGLSLTNNIKRHTCKLVLGIEREFLPRYSDILTVKPRGCCDRQKLTDYFIMCEQSRGHLNKPNNQAGPNLIRPTIVTQTSIENSNEPLYIAHLLIALTRTSYKDILISLLYHLCQKVQTILSH